MPPKSPWLCREMSLYGGSDILYPYHDIPWRQGTQKHLQIGWAFKQYFL